jgi:hypothetical protein
MNPTNLLVVAGSVHNRKARLEICGHRSLSEHHGDPQRYPKTCVVVDFVVVVVVAVVVVVVVVAMLEFVPPVDDNGSNHSDPLHNTILDDVA